MKLSNILQSKPVVFDREFSPQVESGKFFKYGAASNQLVELEQVYIDFNGEIALGGFPRSWEDVCFLILALAPEMVTMGFSKRWR